MFPEFGVLLERSVSEVYRFAEQSIVNRAYELGLDPALRGSDLDRMLTPARTDVGGRARRDAFLNHRYVPIGDYPLPILPDLDLPSPWMTKDVKIDGDPSSLFTLCEALGIEEGRPAILVTASLQPPSRIRKNPGALTAWQLLQPKERVVVSLGHIPEPPHIPVVTLAHTKDHFGLPPQHSVTVCKDTDLSTLFDPPFAIVPTTLEALSITTADSGNPDRPDLRNPTYITNIDGLRAPYQQIDGVLQPAIPDVPLEVTLSDRANTFWLSQLEAGNPYAAYAVHEIAARAARKAAFHNVPWNPTTIEQFGNLTRLSEPPLSAGTLPPSVERKLRWEWQAARRMNPEMTECLLTRLHIPALLLPMKAS